MDDAGRDKLRELAFLWNGPAVRHKAPLFHVEFFQYLDGINLMEKDFSEDSPDNLISMLEFDVFRAWRRKFPGEEMPERLARLSRGQNLTNSVLFPISLRSRVL